MAIMNSGPRRAIAEAVSWALAGSLFLFSAVYQREIRTGLGLDFAPKAGAADEVARSKAPAETESTMRSASSRTEDASSRSLRDTVRLQADRNGHFSAHAYINGGAVDVLVDTGATRVVLTWEDARAAGVRVRDSDFTVRSSTANGISANAPVVLDSIRIGEITLYDVPALVAQRGQLQSTLLGMSFLSKLSVQMQDRELVLSR